MKRWAGIARLGGVGDNLVASSVMRPLKRMGYSTEMITSSSHAAVLQHNPFIDKLSVRQDGDKIPPDRAAEYDLYADLTHSQEARHALFANMPAFRARPEYRRQLCAGNYLETAHDIVGVPHEFGPLFFATDDEIINARKTKDKIGERVLAWVVRGSRVDKVYPYAPSAIARIISELDIPVALVGIGQGQFEMAERLVKEVEISNSSRDKLHIAIAKETDVNAWGVRPSLAFVLQCDLVVTPDTGTAWACAFEPMPKVVILSHASPENITKHWINTTTLHADQNRVPCWPCHQLHDSIETCSKPVKGIAAGCMADIAVERIVRAVDAAWNRTSNVIRLAS